ncbi:hypothetical protein L6164_032189 [Bauhinia variegata]|uniref:Uncharacterized protein n=1 Tax=Bauhinia variegata TaxID=167791 RepID=A0ACB9KN29_BAUVA|nr:hypothetical protein L6164_032189 [Bauhinia variegata]
MISSIKYSTSSLTCSAFSSRKLSGPRPQFYRFPTIKNVQQNTGPSGPSPSSQKPLYVSSTKNFTLLPKLRRRVTECQAYEADRSRPLEINIELPDEQAQIEALQKLKIGLYFATCGSHNWTCGSNSEHVKSCSFIYPHHQKRRACFLCSGVKVLAWRSIPCASLPFTVANYWWFALAAVTQLNFNLTGKTTI